MVLGTIAFANAVVGLISFRTHLWGVGIVGAVSLIFAVALVGAPGAPKYLFAAYALILLAECVYAMARLRQASSRHVGTTLASGPDQAPGLDRDRDTPKRTGRAA
jgi:hypothetical protein